MTHILSLIVGLCLVVFGSLAQATETYTVRSGDTLSAIAKKHNLDMPGLWRANCERVKNPHVIRPSWELVLESKTPAEKSCGNIFEPRRVPVLEKEQSCIRLGEAPWNKFETQELRLKGIDLNPRLTPAQKEEAKWLVLTTKAETRLVTDDMVFQAMPFRGADGKAHFVYDKRICPGKVEVVKIWTLADGTRVADFPTCGNVSSMEKLPSSPPPPVVVETPPAPEPEPVAMPEPEVTPPSVVEPAKRLCEFDPKLVFGKEFEPRRNGNDSKARWLSLAVYCKQRGKAGWHGFGAQFLGSDWVGHVSGGQGKFWGHFLQAGLSHLYTADDGWDTQTSLLYGWSLKERFEESAYKSARDFRTIGIGNATSIYPRKVQGEKSWYELQWNFNVALPISKAASHSWAGNPIADTSELGRLSYLLNATVRQYAAKIDTQSIGPLELYGQGGVQLEIPISKTGNLRVGVTAIDRCVGIGVGADYNFVSHDWVPAWGYWVDAVQCVRFGRTEYRRAQIREEAAKQGLVFEDGLL